MVHKNTHLVRKKIIIIVSFSQFEAVGIGRRQFVYVRALALLLTKKKRLDRHSNEHRGFRWNAENITKFFISFSFFFLSSAWVCKCAFFFSVSFYLCSVCSSLTFHRHSSDISKEIWLSYFIFLFVSVVCCVPCQIRLSVMVAVGWKKKWWHIHICMHAILQNFVMRMMFVYGAVCRFSFTKPNKLHFEYYENNVCLLVTFVGSPDGWWNCNFVLYLQINECRFFEKRKKNTQIFFISFAVEIGI